MSDTAPNQPITLSQDQFEELMWRANQSAQKPSLLPQLGRYVADRLKEPSTWVGVSLAASAFGVHIDPEKFQAFAHIGQMVAGGLLMVSKDPGNKQPAPYGKNPHE
ncbi:MAG: hypothetical protein HQM04_06720 [Magnetococcales bacterium]|nr:hypothetical protein [Magnetococcales bacterium]MBF0114720.1 hypothetical protein [Magnetococcales bacterium]